MNPLLPHQQDRALPTPEQTFKEQLKVFSKSGLLTGYLIVQEDGSLAQTHLLNKLWESAKGVMGYKDLTNDALIEFKTLQLLEKGEREKWITTKDDLENVKTLAERAGLTTNTKSAHKELNELIERISSKNLQPKIKEEAQNLSAKFFRQHQNELNPFADILKFTQVFTKSVSSPKEQENEEQDPDIAREEQNQDSPASTSEEKKENQPQEHGALPLQDLSKEAAPPEPLNPIIAANIPTSAPSNAINPLDLHIPEPNTESVTPITESVTPITESVTPITESVTPISESPAIPVIEQENPQKPVNIESDNVKPSEKIVLESNENPVQDEIKRPPSNESPVETTQPEKITQSDEILLETIETNHPIVKVKELSIKEIQTTKWQIALKVGLYTMSALAAIGAIYLGMGSIAPDIPKTPPNPVPPTNPTSYPPITKYTNFSKNISNINQKTCPLNQYNITKLTPIPPPGKNTTFTTNSTLPYSPLEIWEKIPDTSNDTSRYFPPTKDATSTENNPHTQEPSILPGATENPIEETPKNQELTGNNEHEEIPLEIPVKKAQTPSSIEQSQSTKQAKPDLTYSPFQSPENITNASTPTSPRFPIREENIPAEIKKNIQEPDALPSITDDQNETSPEDQRVTEIIEIPEGTVADIQETISPDHKPTIIKNQTQESDVDCCYTNATDFSNVTDFNEGKKDLFPTAPTIPVLPVSKSDQQSTITGTDPLQQTNKNPPRDVGEQSYWASFIASPILKGLGVGLGGLGILKLVSSLIGSSKPAVFKSSKPSVDKNTSTLTEPLEQLTPLQKTPEIDDHNLVNADIKNLDNYIFAAGVLIAGSKKDKHIDESLKKITNYLTELTQTKINNTAKENIDYLKKISINIIDKKMDTTDDKMKKAIVEIYTALITLNPDSALDIAREFFKRDKDACFSGMKFSVSDRPTSTTIVQKVLNSDRGLDFAKDYTKTNENLNQLFIKNAYSYFLQLFDHKRLHSFAISCLDKTNNNSCCKLVEDYKVNIIQSNSSNDKQYMRKFVYACSPYESHNEFIISYFDKEYSLNKQDALDLALKCYSNGNKNILNYALKFFEQKDIDNFTLKSLENQYEYLANLRPTQLEPEAIKKNAEPLEYIESLTKLCLKIIEDGKDKENIKQKNPSEISDGSLTKNIVLPPQGSTPPDEIKDEVISSESKQKSMKLSDLLFKEQSPEKMIGNELEAIYQELKRLKSDSALEIARACFAREKEACFASTPNKHDSAKIVQDVLINDRGLEFANLYIEQNDDASQQFVQNAYLYLIQNSQYKTLPLFAKACLNRPENAACCEVVEKYKNRIIDQTDIPEPVQNILEFVYACSPYESHKEFIEGYFESEFLNCGEEQASDFAAKYYSQSTENKNILQYACKKFGVSYADNSLQLRIKCKELDQNSALKIIERLQAGKVDQEDKSEWKEGLTDYVNQLKVDPAQPSQWDELIAACTESKIVTNEMGQHVKNFEAYVNSDKDTDNINESKHKINEYIERLPADQVTAIDQSNINSLRNSCLKIIKENKSWENSQLARDVINFTKGLINCHPSSAVEIAEACFESFKYEIDKEKIFKNVSPYSNTDTFNAFTIIVRAVLRSEKSLDFAKHYIDKNNSEGRIFVTGAYEYLKQSDNAHLLPPFVLACLEKPENPACQAVIKDAQEKFSGEKDLSTAGYFVTLFPFAIACAQHNQYQGFIKKSFDNFFDLDKEVARHFAVKCHLNNSKEIFAHALPFFEKTRPSQSNLFRMECGELDLESATGLCEVLQSPNSNLKPEEKVKLRKFLTDYVPQLRLDPFNVNDTKENKLKHDALEKLIANLKDLKIVNKDFQPQPFKQNKPEKTFPQEKSSESVDLLKAEPRELTQKNSDPSGNATTQPASPPKKTTKNLVLRNTPTQSPTKLLFTDSEVPEAIKLGRSKLASAFADPKAQLKQDLKKYKEVSNANAAKEMREEYGQYIKSLSETALNYLVTDPIFWETFAHQHFRKYTAKFISAEQLQILVDHVVKDLINHPYSKDNDLDNLVIADFSKIFLHMTTKDNDLAKKLDIIAKSGIRKLHIDIERTFKSLLFQLPQIDQDRISIDLDSYVDIFENKREAERKNRDAIITQTELEGKLKIEREKQDAIDGKSPPPSPPKKTWSSSVKTQAVLVKDKKTVRTDGTIKLLVKHLQIDKDHIPLLDSLTKEDLHSFAKELIQLEQRKNDSENLEGLIKNLKTYWALEKMMVIGPSLNNERKLRLTAIVEVFDSNAIKETAKLNDFWDVAGNTQDHYAAALFDGFSAKQLKKIVLNVFIEANDPNARLTNLSRLINDSVNSSKADEDPALNLAKLEEMKSAFSTLRDKVKAEFEETQTINVSLYKQDLTIVNRIGKARKEHQAMENLGKTILNALDLQIHPLKRRMPTDLTSQDRVLRIEDSK